jgi:hypothetical protein
MNPIGVERVEFSGQNSKEKAQTWCMDHTVAFRGLVRGTSAEGFVVEHAVVLCI